MSKKKLKESTINPNRKKIKHTSGLNQIIQGKHSIIRIISPIEVKIIKNTTYNGEDNKNNRIKQLMKQLNPNSDKA